MSQAAFDIALRFILDAEGSYVNDPRGPGGPTKHGVSWRAVRLRDVDKDGLLDFDLDKDGDVDADDIKSVTPKQAELLFREDSWDSCRCDELPPGLALAVADCAYHPGPADCQRPPCSAPSASPRTASTPPTQQEPQPLILCRGDKLLVRLRRR